MIYITTCLKQGVVEGKAGTHIKSGHNLKIKFMKIQRFISIVLIFLSLQLTITILHVMEPEIKPVIAYAQVTGQQQGSFTGSASTPGYQGQIAVIGVDLESTTAGSSQIMFQKYPDASSTQLETALANNEKLTNVIIQVVKVVTGQYVPKAVTIYQLTNAHIKSIGKQDSFTDITLTADKINITNL
jgi:type VI protein secretion system component Hcp